MEPGRKLSPRDRWLRLGGGLALVAVGCGIFAYSKAHDPANRAAALGLIAIFCGLSLTGQGLRGRTEPLDRRAAGPAPAGAPAGAPAFRPGTAVRPTTAAPPGAAISPERTAVSVVLAWLVPGLGHWILGRRGKALLFFLTITLTFVTGVVLAEGRNLNYERDAIYFLAYVFNAVETALGWALTHRLELDHRIPYLELGFLYTAVACLLNLVATMDVLSTCTQAIPAEATAPEATAPAEAAAPAEARTRGRRAGSPEEPAPPERRGKGGAGA